MTPETQAALEDLDLLEEIGWFPEQDEAGLAKRFERIRAAITRGQAAYKAAKVERTLSISTIDAIKEQVEEEQSGFWTACSGCHQTYEGYETGEYLYSDVFKCHVGIGCSECGGIGVIWDNTDYSEMDKGEQG